jgi:hypothetical protein
MAYLCVNRKIRLPAVRRYNLTDPILGCLRRNLLDILKWIFELLLRRTIRWRFLQSMRSYPFCGLSASCGLSSSFHARHVQRSGMHRTEMYWSRIRMIAIAIHSVLASSRRGVTICRTCRRGSQSGSRPSTRRGNLHHRDVGGRVRTGGREIFVESGLSQACIFRASTSEREHSASLEVCPIVGRESWKVLHTAAERGAELQTMLVHIIQGCDTDR